MRWATRPRLHVDRLACAWLILRHVDPEAEFVFCADIEDVPEGATPFDMRGAALSHHGDDCSFETFLRHYDLDDRALHALARIVHEADLGDERFDAAEAPGLDVVLRGLAADRDDHELIDAALPIFDGLHAFLARSEAPHSSKSFR